MASKTVWLSAKPTGTVTVDISVNNPSGVVVTTDKSTLTYNPSTYARGQHVLFTAVNDTDTNAGTVTVTLTANGGGYSNVTKTLSITVKETTETGNTTPRAGIQVDRSHRSLTETGAGSSRNFKVNLTQQPLHAATITATSSDTSAVTVDASYTVTTTSQRRSFTVTAVNDPDALDESVTITFSSTYEWEYTDPSDSTKKARITSTVSQVVGVSVTDDDKGTNSAPTVSSAIADQYVSSSGTGTVALGSVFSDSDSGDTLTYQANSGNGSVATVAVSSSTLTITGVSAGAAEITVTAVDSRGESVADTFLVYVGVTGGGTLVDTNLNVGASATYDLKKKFRGPSSMTFAASSSDTNKVGTSISSGVLTVSAKAAGSATVTATATAGSDSKTARFTVNVNRVPTVANAISDVTIANGASTTVSLANVFSDADNDTLGLSASASNSAALTVSVSGTTLSLTAKQHTIVSVRVIANDGKSQVQDVFTVTINSAPTVANAVADAGPLPAGQTLTVNMNNVFSDADSDYFTFGVTTSDSAVATVSWSDGTLTVTGVALGSATITMTASDNYGGSVSDSFAVTVTAGGNAPPPPDNNDPNDPPYEPPVQQDSEPPVQQDSEPPVQQDSEPPVQQGSEPPVQQGGGGGGTPPVQQGGGGSPPPVPFQPVVVYTPPPAFSVGNTTVTEGQGAQLAFTISLDRAVLASDGTVSVDYATGGGTATAGADYTATSGTLTFAVGEQTKTVNVPVLEDAHPDGGETLELVLSNATSATITDGTGTGTIKNAATIPRAWSARFGRTIGTHITDAVSARLRDTGDAESHLTVAGWRMPLGSRQTQTDATRQASASATDSDQGTRLLTGLAGLLGLNGQTGGNQQTGPVGGNPNGTPWLNGPSRQQNPGQALTLPDFRQALVGSAFRLNLNQNAGGNVPRLTAWGRVAHTQFDGQEGRLALDGEVTTGTVGLDTQGDRWLAGIAVSHSRGDGGYTIPDQANPGDLDTTLTSLHPYLRYALTDRLTVWGLMGYGWGDLTLTPPGETAIDTDTDFLMGAVGSRGLLLDPATNGGLQVATRLDAMFTRTTTEAVATMAATDADAHRLRLVLEGSRRYCLGRRPAPDPDRGSGGAA